jgi:Methionyl-tRNA formyltransferase
LGRGHFGPKLARDGATTPFIGDFISTFVLVPIGLFLTWMAIREKSINLDAFKTWTRKITRKVMSFFKKTRIVYMGTPEFAVAPLEALMKGRSYKVVGVVTVADKPSGRGLKMNESAVKKFAVAHDLPVLQPDKLKDPAFLEALAAWKADMFVVVGFRMLPEVVWKMPRPGHVQPPRRPSAAVPRRGPDQLGRHQRGEPHRCHDLHDRPEDRYGRHPAPSGVPDRSDGHRRRRSMTN